MTIAFEAPTVRRIAVRTVEVDTGKGGTHPMFRVGIVLPDGAWEDPSEDAKGYTFTEQEAWCRAGLLASLTDLPVEQVDFKPDGTIIATHPAFYMQRRQQ